MLQTNNFRVDTAQLTSRIQAELQVPRRASAPAPAPAVPAQAPVLSTFPDAVAATVAPPPAPSPSEGQPFRHRLRDVPLVGSLLSWAWGLARLADTRSAAHTALTRASDAWNFAAAQEPWVRAREAQFRGQVDAGLQGCLGQIQGVRAEIQQLRTDSERDIAVMRVEMRGPFQEIATLRSEIEQVRASLAEHRQAEQRLQAELEQLRAALWDHRESIDTTLGDHRESTEAALADHRKSVEAALADHREAAERASAEHRRALEAQFLAALSGEAAARQSAEQETRHRLAALRQEVLFQQRRLSASLEVRGTTSSHQDPGAGPSAPPREGAVDDRLNAFYAQFEDAFRGSREDIKARVAVHADRIVLAGAGTPERPVLDIGCGRGEWLEVLREHGLAAYGIDTNDVTVSACRARGLDARRAEALGHLRSLADGSIGGVTAFHVAEHLPLDVLADLLDETLRVLEPGGVLLLETPNPENLLVGGMTFYNDPTHRNPLPPAVLQFLVRQRGFVDAEIVRLHPFPDDHLLPQDDVIGQRLNHLLYGPQDYAVVARKV